MIVRPRQPSLDHPALTAGHQYAVVGIEADHFRLIDDQGEPTLYPAELFEVVDASEPGDWVKEVGEGGERYAYPSPLNRPGFFEDYFDADPTAVATFWRIINRHLATTAA